MFEGYEEPGHGMAGLRVGGSPGDDRDEAVRAAGDHGQLRADARLCVEVARAPTADDTPLDLNEEIQRMLRDLRCDAHGRLIDPLEDCFSLRDGNLADDASADALTIIGLRRGAVREPQRECHDR